MALRFRRALRASVLYSTEARKAKKVIGDTVDGGALSVVIVRGCFVISLLVHFDGTLFTGDALSQFKLF